MSNTIAITKRCSDCGALLVERTNGKNGSTFLGCSNYPECRHTEPVPESVKMRRAGQRDMFDDARLNGHKLETLAPPCLYHAQVTLASGEVYLFRRFDMDQDQIDASDIELVTSYMRYTLHCTLTGESFYDVLLDAQGAHETMSEGLDDYLYEREDDE